MKILKKESLESKNNKSYKCQIFRARKKPNDEINGLRHLGCHIPVLVYCDLQRGKVVTIYCQMLHCTWVGESFLSGSWWSQVQIWSQNKCLRRAASHRHIKSQCRSLFLLEKMLNASTIRLPIRRSRKKSFFVLCVLNVQLILSGLVDPIFAVRFGLLWESFSHLGFFFLQGNRFY